MSDELSQEYTDRRIERDEAEKVRAFRAKVDAYRAAEDAKAGPPEAGGGSILESALGAAKSTVLPDYTVPVAKDLARGAPEAAWRLPAGVLQGGINDPIRIFSAAEEWLESAKGDPEAGIARKAAGAAVEAVKITAGQLPTDEQAEPFQIPQPSEPAKTVTGGIAQGIGEFVGALIGINKAAAGLKVPQAASKIGQLARFAGLGAVADMTITEKEDLLIADFLKEFPALDKIIPDFMASDPEDSAATHAFQAALEGLVLGTAADGVFLGFSALRAARAARVANEAAGPSAIVPDVMPLHTFTREEMDAAMADELPGRPAAAETPGAKGVPKQPAREIQHAETPEAAQMDEYIARTRDPVMGLDSTCQKCAAEFAGETGGEYVEGVITGGMPPRKILHSWVEKDGNVYDPVNGLAVSKESYSQIFKAEETYRESGDEAMRRAAKTGSYELVSRPEGWVMDDAGHLRPGMEASSSGEFSRKALSSASDQSAASREILIEMDIDDFLKLAEEGVDKGKEQVTREVLERGEKFGSIPFLGFDNQGGGVARVVGHEGRHRARALKEKGYKTMPVRFLSQEGGGGDAIRWGNQDPGELDFVEDFPTTLKAQKGDHQVDFPVSQGQDPTTLRPGLGDHARAAETEPLVPRIKGTPPRTVLELQQDFRAASPGEIGNQKAAAIGVLVEGGAKYKNMTPDEYVRWRYREVTQGGTPADDALFSANTLERWARRAQSASKTRGLDASSVLEELPHLERLGRLLNKKPELLSKEYKGSPIRTNDDYIKTADFNTNCPKRREYNTNVRAIEKELDRPLSADELYGMSMMYKAEGKTGPCVYCYTEAGRRQFNDYVLAYSKKNPDFDLAGFNEWWRSEQGTRQKSWRAAGRGGGEVAPKGAQSGDAPVPAEWEEVRGKAQSSSFANAEKAFSPYKGELFSISDAKMKEIDDRAGLRFSSNTDFQVDHVLDWMQTIVDTSILRQKAHAYTKDPRVARIFGPTGMRINQSVFAKISPKGRVVQDTANGMPWKDAKKGAADFPDDVGNILVATDEKILAWSLDQDWIDMVIPFHSSGMKASQVSELGYKNFSSTQLETWIRPKDHVGQEKPHFVFAQHKNDKETYLRLCDEAGVHPRFREYVDHPNYMKLVNDTVKGDIPQKIVQPNFNYDEAEKVVTKWQKQGGYSADDSPDQRVVDHVVERINAGDELYATRGGSARASIEFGEDGSAVIRALNSPTVIDMAHEVGHVFRRDLEPEDLATAETWAGVVDGVWTREAEEKFATGFERYLAEGKAPTPQLQEVFDKFKQWMTEIYGQIQGSEIDIEISQPIRDVFDKLTASDEAFGWKGGDAFQGWTPDSPPVQVHKGRVYANWARMDTETYGVKEMIRDTMKANEEGIIKEQRGTVSHEQTLLEAQREDAVDIVLSRREGQAYNAAEATAVRQLHIASSESVLKAAQAAWTNRNPKTLFTLRRKMAIHQLIQREMIGGRTETARALNAWKIPAGSDAEMTKQLESMVQQWGGEAVTLNMAEKVMKLTREGNLNRLEDFIQVSNFAKTQNAVAAAWYFSMLSSPLTHVRNFIGNSVVVAQAHYEPATAMMIGKLLGEETYPKGHIVASAMGTLHGFKMGLRITSQGLAAVGTAGKQIARGEGLGAARETIAENADEFGTAYRAGVTGEAGIGIGKLEEPSAGAFSSEVWELDPDSGLGRFADLVDGLISSTGKGLQAGDEVFKTAGYFRELYAQANMKVRQEIADGTLENTPEAMATRAAEIISDPDEAIRLLAMKHAEYSTFTQPVGEWGKTLMQLANRTHIIGRLALPFRRTIINIASYGFERMPVLARFTRQYKEDMAAGGARKHLAMAKQATGSMALFAFADLAMSGMITGDGPTNAKKREAWKRQGWQPNSIRIENEDGSVRYHSIRSMEPLSTHLNMAANIVQILQNTDGKNDDEDIGKIIYAVTMSIAAQATSASYMTGLSDFFDMMGDPTRYSERYFRRLQGSLVPSGAAHIARVVDPMQRDVNSMIDELMKRTPGLSKLLPNVRDNWGYPVTFASGLGKTRDFFSPSFSKEVNQQPVDLELNRLQLWLGRPGKKVHFQASGIGDDAPYGTERDSVQINLKHFPKAYDRYLEIRGHVITQDQYGTDIDYDGHSMIGTLNNLVEGNHTDSVMYWEDLTDGADGGKARHIRTIIGRFDDAAKAQVLQEFPRLRQKLIDELLSKQTDQWRQP